MISINLFQVILRIQSCEALLASATDKGEQIAAEGSAADQNSITEQLQSLKQQLQALRRAVENQRQKHLDAEQQHMKLAAELDVLLDWLHTHEGVVKQRPLLEIPKESVEREEEKHKVFSRNLCFFFISYLPHGVRTPAGDLYFSKTKFKLFIYSFLAISCES